jgi:outer membrane protein assembly factor BamB
MNINATRSWRTVLGLFAATLGLLLGPAAPVPSPFGMFAHSGGESTAAMGGTARSLAFSIGGSAAMGAEPSPGGDWTYWRGPEQNGIARVTGLPDKWDPRGGEGSNLVWKRTDLGGRSTPITYLGKLYTIVRDQPGTAEEGEKVVCVDAATGKTAWEHRFNVWSSDVPDTRLGWSSVIADPSSGNLYVLGVCGYFACLNAESGKLLWKRALHEEFGLLSTYGGRTNFPIVCDDLVIISAVVIGWGEMARPAHRFLAFNKLTGQTTWFASTTLLPEDTTYSAPIITMLNGQKALVIGCGDGKVWAFQPRTGKVLWQYAFSRRGLNIAPLADGQRIYMGHSEENIKGTAMGAVALIDGAKTGNITESGTIWKTEELGIGKSSILKVDNRLYCFDDAGKLWVVDATTGEKIGRRFSVGTMGRASPLYADGKIYYMEANGRWWILTPDEKQGVKVTAKGNFGTGEECNASPIASYGRVYVQTSEATYCFADAGKTPKFDPVPPPAAEPPATDDPTPALVQVVPCELLLRPGDSQKLTVKLFNSKGQFLKESPAEFTVEGPGEVSSDGTLKVPADASHVATFVTAKVGELSGKSRVRIVPPLPWKFDFEGLTDAPLTWVGARYRHVTRKVDGSNVIVKVTTIPKGTRSRCWFGQSDLSDYTIQADVKGATADNKMPDIGLIAQGYTLDMQGLAQKLFLTSWVSHDHRHFKRIDFKWEPNKWYTIKFQAANKDGKAYLKAKVWPRDDKEPAEWTVELEDSRPNTQGSPGLFGNATNAEIFIDNVTVTPNK